MTIPYTYRVIHLPSKKWYYGVRYANKCNPSDLWRTYFTSSRIIKELLEKEGPSAFSVEIRKIFNTREEAIIWENRVLKRILKWETCLNENAFPAVTPEARARGIETKRKIQKDGLTIFQQQGKRWKAKQLLIDPKTGLTFKRQRHNHARDMHGTRVKSKEFCQWFSENNPSKREDVKAKISATLKRRIANGEVTTTKGMKFPAISKMLSGNQHVKGLIWVNDGKIDKRISGDIPTGFSLGRLKVNNKGHEYKTLTCPKCGKAGGGGNMKRYHFANCTSIS